MRTLTLILFFLCSISLKAQDTLFFFLNQNKGDFWSIRTRPHDEFPDVVKELKIDPSYTGIVHIDYERLSSGNNSLIMKVLLKFNYVIKNGKTISEKTEWFQKTRYDIYRFYKYKVAERFDSLELVTTLHPTGRVLTLKRTNLTENKPFGITEYIDKRFGKVTTYIKNDSSEVREVFRCLDLSCSAWWGDPIERTIKTFNNEYHHTRNWQGGYLMSEEIKKYGVDTVEIGEYWMISHQGNYILEFRFELKNDKLNGLQIDLANDTTAWKRVYIDGELVNIKNDSVLYLNTKSKQISKAEFIEVFNTFSSGGRLNFDEIILSGQQQILTGGRYKYLFYIFDKTDSFKGKKREKLLEKVLKKAD